MGMTELAVVVVVMLAGLMRGITGFGGAMLMAPPLSVLIGPVATVVTALILESAAALVMFPDALPRINKRVLGFLILPAFVTVPLGGYVLITLDPFIARKLIAAVVVVFSLGLLAGVRYSGQPRPTTSLMLGSVVGVLVGSTSVGAPPVILYLLSGPDPHAVTRANLTVFVTTISLAGLIMLLFAGEITDQAGAFGVAAVHSLSGRDLVWRQTVRTDERDCGAASGARLHAGDGPGQPGALGHGTSTGAVDAAVVLSETTGKEMPALKPFTSETIWARFEPTEADWESDDPAVLARMLEQLQIVRVFEEKVLELKGEQLLHGPAHSSIGQEGAAVGCISVLGAGDKINGTHRMHHQFLAKVLNWSMPAGLRPARSASRASDMHRVVERRWPRSWG